MKHENLEQVNSLCKELDGLNKILRRLGDDEVTVIVSESKNMLPSMVIFNLHSSFPDPLQLGEKTQEYLQFIKSQVQLKISELEELLDKL